MNKKREREWRKFFDSLTPEQRIKALHFLETMVICKETLGVGALHEMTKIAKPKDPNPPGTEVIR